MPVLVKVKEQRELPYFAKIFHLRKKNKKYSNYPITSANLKGYSFLVNFFRTTPS